MPVTLDHCCSIGNTTRRRGSDCWEDGVHYVWYEWICRLCGGVVQRLKVRE